METQKNLVESMNGIVSTLSLKFPEVGKYLKEKKIENVLYKQIDKIFEEEGKIYFHEFSTNFHS